MADLAGRVVLVTGGARGIGRAIATALRDEGCRVVISDVDRAAVHRTAETLDVVGLAHDVTDPEQWRTVVREIETREGPIDVLVNNAGIMPLGSFLEQEPAMDRRQLDINLFGVMHGMRAVLPSMQARRSGHVVNLASAAGRVGVPHAAVYSASKFAVVGLTEAVHAELQGSGVRLTFVCPGFVRTELIAGARAPRFPPVSTPEHVAAAVARALHTGQLEVYVPRSARLAAVLPAILPRRVGERLARALHLDRMFVDVDATAREAYVARAGVSGP